MKGGEGGYGDKESGVGRAEISGDGEAKKKKRGPVAGFFPGVQRSRQEAGDVQSVCACAVDGRLPDKHSGVRDGQRGENNQREWTRDDSTAMQRASLSMAG